MALLQQGLDKITGSKTPTLHELTTNVELFNGISLDESKEMFKDCLGTDFPFDVIDSVQNYANDLSKFLNSSLDDLLCGSAISNVVNETEIFAEQMSNDADKYVLDPLFSSEEEKQAYAENGMATTHIVSGNDWVKTWNKSNFPDFPQGDDVFDNSFDVSYTLTSGNLGARQVRINLSYMDNTSGSAPTPYVSVSIDGLYKGPHDGSGPDRDGTNVLGEASGDFIYYPNDTKFSKEQKIRAYPMETVVFTGELKISCKIQYTQYENDFVLSISELVFDTCWSDISTTLTSNQKANVDAIYNETLDNVKNQALQTLKTEFMSSSLMTETLQGSINDLKNTYPALSKINANGMTEAISRNLADNAINIYNGKPADVSSLVKDTIATEVATSSINTGLESLGVKASISTDCTKELLDKVAGPVLDAVGDLANDAINGVVGLVQEGLQELSDFLTFDIGAAFATDVTDKMDALFESKLLSSDCIKAVNNNFDICSHQMANAAGAVADLAQAKTTASAAAKSAASQYLKVPGM